MGKYHGDGVYNHSDISAFSLWLYHPAMACMDTHPGSRGCLTKLYIINTLSTFKMIHQLDTPLKRIKQYQCCVRGFFLIHFWSFTLLSVNIREGMQIRSCIAVTCTAVSFYLCTWWWSWRTPLLPGGKKRALRSTERTVRKSEPSDAQDL